MQFGGLAAAACLDSNDSGEMAATTDAAADGATSAGDDGLVFAEAWLNLHLGRSERGWELR